MFEIGRNCHARGVYARAGLDLTQQPRALDLGLVLGAGEGMPAALALTGLRIADVDDDGPVTGRTFADVAFHFSSLSHPRSAMASSCGPSGMSLTWRQSLASANSSSMRLAMSG